MMESYFRGQRAFPEKFTGNNRWTTTVGENTFHRGHTLAPINRVGAAY